MLVVIALLPSVGNAERFDRFYGALGFNFFDSVDSSGNVAHASSGVSTNLSLGRYLPHRDHISLDVSYSKMNSSNEYSGPFQQVQASQVVSVGVTCNAYRTFFERGRFSLYAGAGAESFRLKFGDADYPLKGTSGRSPFSINSR